jgi:4-oxalocrotonate tautomerase
MPYVNVKVAGKISDAEKKRVIIGIAALLEKELGKAKSTTYTVIEEIDPNSWGVGDLTVAETRAKS